MEPGDEVGVSSLPVSGAAEEKAEGLPLTKIIGTADAFDDFIPDYGEQEQEQVPDDLSEKADSVPDAVIQAATALGTLASAPPDDLASGRGSCPACS